MCLVQLHKSSKSASYKEMADYSVPARIVTTAYSSSDDKHQKVHIVNTSGRRSSVHIPSTTAVHSSPASSGYTRAQRRSTMSGGPERGSYISSRGAAYHRSNEKSFYGRDSGEPLLMASGDMGSGDHSGDDKSFLDSESITSSRSTTEGVNGSVIIKY